MRIPSNLIGLMLMLTTACLDKASLTEDSAEAQGEDAVDADGDGFVAAEDCDDQNADAYPGADELCSDGLDNDCDDEIDEDDSVDASTFYADADEDGFGDAEVSTSACEVPTGYVEDSADCDDTDNAQHPDADEVCNGEDDDCDGETDESGALDESTWYADADGDGYGDESQATLACDLPSGFADTSTDCDDSSAQIHPNADEMCDGQDTDCDASTNEAGLVSLEDVDGVLWDMTADFSGTVSAPATPILDSEDGTYWFCEGVHIAHTTVEADVSLRSMNGDPSTTVLYGADLGTVISMVGDGWTLEIVDLSIMNGAGEHTLPFPPSPLENAGGGIYCEGESLLSLDGVILSSNSASWGGAIAVSECDVETISTEIKDNEASTGGALFLLDSSLDLLYTNLESNRADTVAGAIFQVVMYESVDFDMSETLFFENDGGSGGGVTVLQNYNEGSIDGTCHGTTSTESGFLDNDAGAYAALSLVGDDVSFESDGCDWGEDGTSDDNDPADIYFYTESATTSENSEYFYRLGDDYDIVCESGQCGTPTTYTLASTTSSGSTSDDARGVRIASENTATLDEFSVLVNPDESCNIGLYVLSQDAASSTWSVEYSNIETVSSGLDWVSSGVIGMAMEDDVEYALVFGWDCDLTYYYDGSAGGSLLDAGFGTTNGRWIDTSYTGYSGTTSDDSYTSDIRYYMNITTSN